MFNKKGFTLIELLIVMAVIAVLIGIAIPSFRGMQNQAKAAKAGGDLRVLKLAVEAYNANHNVLPATIDVLTAEANGVVSAMPIDPFTSAEYKFSVDNGTTARYYVIWSQGQDATAPTIAISAGGAITGSTANTIGTTNGTPSTTGSWK